MTKACKNDSNKKIDKPCSEEVTHLAQAKLLIYAFAALFVFIILRVAAAAIASGDPFPLI